MARSDQRRDAEGRQDYEGRGNQEIGAEWAGHGVLLQASSEERSARAVPVSTCRVTWSRKAMLLVNNFLEVSDLQQIRGARL
jgi:hypothetical protein